VHVIAEGRPRIRRGVEIVVARGRTEFALDRAQDRVPVGLEGIIARPDLVDDLDAGVVAVGVEADQPPARPQRARQRKSRGNRRKASTTNGVGRIYGQVPTAGL
jgi:hypothetical protein